MFSVPPILMAVWNLPPDVSNTLFLIVCSLAVMNKDICVPVAGLAAEGPVKVVNDEDAKRVVNSARKVPIAYGQRYHLLAMEDIE